MKTRSTYYTPDKIARARANAARYDWAREMREEAVRKAEHYLSRGWEALRDAVGSQQVPRSYAVNEEIGCPICGADAFRFGRFAWYGDPLNDPWKIYCPNCRNRFPTNDFASYYASGLDERGEFRPELADRSLLVNELYPERGESWGVDDGFGWTDEAGNRFTFVACYHHWKVWMKALPGNPPHAPSSLLDEGGIVAAGLDALRDACVLTGEPRYARAGLALLCRVADVYPRMDCSVFRWEDGFKNSHGMRGTGKAVGCIWETLLVQSLILAYDAFFPVLSDPEALRILRVHGGTADPESVQRHIEESILLPVLDDIRADRIRGNNGMHQCALALAAVVLDRPEVTGAWLRLLFGTPVPGEADAELNLTASLVNDLDRDGFGDEAAPHYNHLWTQMFRRIADAAAGAAADYPEADLYRHPFFVKMLKAHRHLILPGQTTAAIGDSGQTGVPELVGEVQDAVDDYERTGDPDFALLAWRLNGKSWDGLRGSLFSEDPEGVADRIRTEVQKAQPQEQSVHLGGFGYAALHGTDGESERALWMYYGRNDRHGHRDTLNIGLHAFGFDLAPDLGYPEHADNSPHRHHWVKHTVSHNTVLVDRSMQRNSLGGEPLHYVCGRTVRMFEAHAPEVYPHTSMYRRCAASIGGEDGVGGDEYWVDFFRVAGGREHHYSFHGPSGEAEVYGVELVAQPHGTAAGPEFPYGVPGDADPQDSPNAYRGSGFHYLTNVERSAHAVEGVFAAEWRVPSSDVRLRATMLGSYDEVMFADGIPPRNKPGNPPRLRYMLVSRAAKDADAELCSQFVAVLEPYRRERRIAEICEAEICGSDGLPVADPRIAAVKVVLRDGRTDYIYSSAIPEFCAVIDGLVKVSGAFAVYSLRGGKPVRAFLHAGTLLGDAIRHEHAGLTGTVVRFTESPSASNEIVVRFDKGFSVEDVPADGSAGVAVMGSAGRTMYTIYGLRPLGGNLWAIGIGEASLIRSWDNGGYTYDITPGDTAVIYRTSEQVFG